LGDKVPVYDYNSEHTAHIEDLLSPPKEPTNALKVTEQKTTLAQVKPAVTVKKDLALPEIKKME